MQETNWFQDLTTDEARQERANLAQRLIAGLGAVCLIVLVLLAATWPTKAHADPRFQVSTDKFRVVVYDEPCKLTDQISNLPYRATWQEGSKVYEGCWAPRTEIEAVVFYFADKTVGIIPFGALKPVQGA
jgi:hypothetical protein